MPGDPILVIVKGELHICQIKCLNVEEIIKDKILFKVVIMKIDSYGDSYIWTN